MEIGLARPLGPLSLLKPPSEYRPINTSTHISNNRLFILIISLPRRHIRLFTIKQSHRCRTFHNSSKYTTELTQPHTAYKI